MAAADTKTTPMWSATMSTSAPPTWAVPMRRASGPSMPSHSTYRAMPTRASVGRDGGSRQVSARNTTPAVDTWFGVTPILSNTAMTGEKTLSRMVAKALCAPRSSLLA